MADKNLGKLLSVHGIAPVILQRAAIIAVLSLMFFLAMLFAFSLRRHFGYLLLAAAFLIVQIFTMSGWIMQKRTQFKLYEKGFAYKKDVCSWEEIRSIKVKRHKDGNIIGGEIIKKDGAKTILTETLDEIGSIISQIEKEVRKVS